MSEALRYNDRLTMSEYRIASLDEIDLEALIWEHPEPSTDLHRLYQEADRAALRKIDGLKTAGEYEAERARLATYIEPIPEDLLRIQKRIADYDYSPLNNFLAGLASRDAEQRARFEELYKTAGLAEKSVPEVLHILQCLEPARGARSGRPKAIPPWRNEIDRLEEMRLAVQAGRSIPDAAKIQAAKPEFKRRGTPENQAEYLGKLYRKRQALRE